MQKIDCRGDGRRGVTGRERDRIRWKLEDQVGGYKVSPGRGR